MQLNRQLLKTSIFAFLLAFLPPLLAEALFGPYNFFAFIWALIPVAFHEIGHLLFSFLVSWLLSVIPRLSFLAGPSVFLGGFLFNAIAGIFLLWFSLLLFSRIQAGGLPETGRQMAFSIMLIAYLNLFLLPYTLTHLAHVVSPTGIDFTMASSLLLISLDELLGMLWAVCGAAIAIALLINVLFVLRSNE